MDKKKRIDEKFFILILHLLNFCFIGNNYNILFMIELNDE